MPTSDRVVITLADNVSAAMLPAYKAEQDAELQVRGVKPDAIRLDYYRPGEPVAHQTSKNLNIRVRPDSPDRIMNVTIELLDRTPQGATPPDERAIHRVDRGCDAGRGAEAAGPESRLLCQRTRAHQGR